MLAAKAIAIGVLTNTVYKAAVATVIGTGRFRWLAAAGLGVLAATAVVGLYLGGRFS